MIRLGLQRWYGSLLTLGVGCWLVFGAKVFFRCPECEGLYDCRISQVASDGGVDFGGWEGQLFMCQTPSCGYARFLKFEGWPPAPPFDLSDGGS